MASLDVESLFINIPIDETIKNAVDDMFSNNILQGNSLRVNSITFYNHEHLSHPLILTFYINKLM